MELTIECSKRDPKSKPNALRRQGLLPAVLYGHDGANSISLTVNEREMSTLLRKAKVQETPIMVNIPDLSWNGEAIVQEVQTHPWKKEIYHISFFVQK
ncbi:50S ribosomal protein L25 [Pseudanabaena sp. FACHB-2040]|uniref:50S ribosomal protein L25 n=1 Tax=Pseudanabaena sp. FACHB-2040 TaxID=2692859 RepID=UPI0016888BE9|nr:50S ribosomal protein L25 [Pseudanabaena sp. FACHB-2040]MBD0269962.1 50S ribosomal protein L25 [Cyanobacteria bacterium Co-bin8]MBD2258762.1 50S ribosomal protein L25 [Pseudanabaena sp. FACHB-2040]